MAGWMKNDPRLTFDEASHTYRLGETALTSVTQALAIAGLADFSGPWFSDAVKARGTYVHQAIQMDVEGVLDYDALDDAIRGSVDGWRAFLMETGAEIEFAEQMLCDPDHRVAGRLDYIVTVTEPSGRMRRTLLDIKRALYPCAAVQLAAYVDMAAALYDHPVVFQRAALVLPGDGSYRLHTFTDSLDRATWQAVLRVLHWRAANGVAA